MKWPWRKQARRQIPISSVLYLFPDTNFFMQCKPPEQLDWSTYATYSEVHVLVSRPVQKEVDRLKNRGSDRLGDKARKTATLLRSVVLSDAGEFIARGQNPRVVVKLRTDLRPDRSADPRLDMSEADDQLVAIAHAFSRSAPECAVLVLTADSGVMASAKMLNLGLAEIPENWLLPPESDRNERTIRRLTEELARYKGAEPRFEIKYSSSNKTSSEGRIELTILRYKPLEKPERLSLMERLKEHVPEASDFGPAEQEPKNIRSSGFMNIWEPVSEEEKEEYRSSYADWLEAVDQYFCAYHEALNAVAEPASVTIEIQNVGSRPGKDALVEIRAAGDFRLCVPPDLDDEAEEKSALSELPKPPAPPAGKWITAFERDGKIQKLANMGKLSDVLQTALGRGFQPPEFYPSIRLPDISPPDPNRFYYKPTRPVFGADIVTFECQQWRHSIPPEKFYVELQLPHDAECVESAIHVSVHAENLTEVASRTIPIRLRHQLKSCLDQAACCIQDLGAKSSAE